METKVTVTTRGKSSSANYGTIERGVPMDIAFVLCQRCGLYLGQHYSQESVRALMKRLFWEARGGKWFCPECVKLQIDDVAEREAE